MGEKRLDLRRMTWWCNFREESARDSQTAVGDYLPIPAPFQLPFPLRAKSFISNKIPHIHHPSVVHVTSLLLDAGQELVNHDWGCKMLSHWPFALAGERQLPHAKKCRASTELLTLKPSTLSVTLFLGLWGSQASPDAATVSARSLLLPVPKNAHLGSCTCSPGCSLPQGGGVRWSQWVEFTSASADVAS